MMQDYLPQVLVDTSNLSREDWLVYRRMGIGGSDAAAVLGVSPFRTARDLYYDKRGIVSTSADEDNWVQLEVGNLLEPLVARIFEKKTGLKVYQRKAMFRHPLYPWMLADLDYLVDLPDGKTAPMARRQFWRSRRPTTTREITGGTTARRSSLSTMTPRGGTIWP